MQNSIRRLITLTIATVLASIFGTAASFAAVAVAGGGPLIRVDIRSDTAAASTSSTSFVDHPGARVRIIIPTTGGSRLVVARFSAESDCNGTHCSMRIVAVNAGTSALIEMLPQAGLDFKFDTPYSSQQESHSFERSLRLEPGTYFIRAQWAVTDAAIIFTLDDWHFTVSQYD